MRNDEHGHAFERVFDGLANPFVHPVKQCCYTGNTTLALDSATYSRSTLPTNAPFSVRIASPFRWKSDILTGRFVHDKQFAPLQQCASQSYQLPLSSRHVTATGRDRLVQICESLGSGLSALLPGKMNTDPAGMRMSSLPRRPSHPVRTILTLRAIRLRCALD